MTWRADPPTYERNGRFNVELAGPVLELLAATAGERVLDLGCGDGALTRRLLEAGVDVLGVDASAEMVEATRRRGVPAEVVDGHELGVELGPVDAVFSNAALHWMTDPARVVDGVRSVLRPGGRFVAEFGGFGNVASFRLAARAALREVHTGDLPQWYFPTSVAYRNLLTSHGFAVEHCALVPRPTPLPTGLRAWFTTFAMDETADHAEDFLGLVEQLLSPIARDERGVWWADYVRLRVRARRR